MNADYDHCEALVRDRDRERFLSALYAPAETRPHLMALYAFDLEVARVADAVNEPMAGEIRFQWWREAIAGERAEEVRANPVAAALLETVRQHKLPVGMLTALLDARQFDLLGQPMETREQLEGYLDATTGAIVECGLCVLGGPGDRHELARDAGRAIGFTRMLRNFPFDVSKGRLFVPLDLLAAHEVHTASVFGGENSDGLRAVLAMIRDWTRSAHLALREQEIPAYFMPALLPAALTPLYLARMQRSGYDPFRSDVSMSALRSQFELWRAARAGRI